MFYIYVFNETKIKNKNSLMENIVDVLSLYADCRFSQ